MAATKIVLHIICLLIWGDVHHARLSLDEQQNGLTMADVGDTVTLHCFYQKDDMMLFITWYKQRLGDKPEMLASRMKLTENATLSDTFKNDPRFLVVAGEGINHLTISDVQLSDSAMYYCGLASYVQIQFDEGIMLIVKGSSSSIQAIVQEPPEKSVQPGDSVTLNCTVHTECCGQHSVHWFFRQTNTSQPVFFYAHDQRCEIAKSTQGSFYNFSVKNLRLSDAGIYYCAVASCGEILYGNGTRLNVGEDECRKQMEILVFLSIVRTAVVLCCLLILTICYITRK